MQNLKNAVESVLNPLMSQPFDQDEIDQRVAESAARERRILAHKLMEKSNLPHRHRQPVEARGEGWISLLARVEDKAYSGFIIALCGSRGTGKTQLAATIAKTYAGAGKAPLYATAMGFFLDIKESFEGKRSEKAVIDAYCGPSLLILDELQERGETPWEDRLLTHLIDRRYGAMRDTLLITNQNQTKFLDAIGNSVASRIVETGGVAFCDWPSYRVK